MRIVERDGEVRVIVSDTGMGIRPDDLGKIHDRILDALLTSCGLAAISLASGVVVP